MTEQDGGASPRIAVVGAGIGGSALALALAESGLACDVFEQTRQLREVGAGVQLAPNAVRPLQRLGLADALRSCAVRVAARETRGWNGRPVARTPLGEQCERRFGAPYYTVHRAHLHEALLERAFGERSRLHLGRRLERIDQHEDAAALVFTDGSVHRADLVVGADGIHSVVRRTLVRDEPVFSGLAVHRGLLPAERLSPWAHEAAVRLWLGPEGHLVCYPVAGGTLLSFAATVRTA
ncbi:FAD-dependent monooxygenase, partial [Streptomonospora algeriensis]